MTWNIRTGSPSSAAIRSELRCFAACGRLGSILITSAPPTAPRAVVMKLGALGCLVATRHMRERLEGFQVAAVDTTAAGDAFNAGFAVALAEGKPLLDAAAFANAVAAISVTRHGAQASLPCRDEVSRFLGPIVTV